MRKDIISLFLFLLYFPYFIPDMVRIQTRWLKSSETKILLHIVKGLLEIV